MCKIYSKRKRNLLRQTTTPTAEGTLFIVGNIFKKPKIFDI